MDLIDKYNKVVVKLQEIDQITEQLNQIREKIENDRIELAIELSKEMILQKGDNE